MAQRIAAGLKRKSLTSCSRWAEACRVMGRPYPGCWNFVHHPWLLDMHDSEAEFNVGQKSAQMGYTEWALNTTFFNIDVKGIDCLYILPAKTPDASDFSAARFDPALELSPHLTNMFSDVKNIGHKRAGTTNLYIRGSRARAGLKSVPVGLIILDEVDEMTQENIPLATERVAGQVEKKILAISTPTLPEFGINKMYMESTQEHFFFKCPCCSRLTELVFPQCLEVIGEHVNDERVAESYLKCKECSGKLSHELKPEWLKGSRWVPGYANRYSRGFHVNQLYSCTVRPDHLARKYLRSLGDPSEEQEFYNSSLGLPHVVSGAQITDADINQCIGSYRKNSIAPSKIITMGIDVGKVLHYEIDEWTLGPYVGSDIHMESKCRILDFGKVNDFEQLDQLMTDNRVFSCVIDANPERRCALQFANRFFGHVKTCTYGQGVNGKEIHVSQQEDHTITVDRTAWLDLALGRFKKKTIETPIDLDHEYKTHLKALVRIYKKDKDGNPVGRYENGNKDDHYAHSRNYAEIALQFATSMMGSYDIRSPV